MANTCSGCGARWTGLTMAHCAAPGCHATFSSAASFDAHRVNGQCQDPASLRVEKGPRAGEARFRQDDRGVWVDNRPRPEFYHDRGECDFFQGVGSCSFSCTDEPTCQTMEPEGGWPSQRREKVSA